MKKLLLTLFMALIACFGVVAADYVKVTSAPSDWSGEYALVYEGTGNNQSYAFTGIDSIGTAQTPGSTTVTITNGTISNYTGATIVVAALANGGYSVAVKGGTNDGKYISSGSSGPSFTNALKFNSTAHRVDFALTDGAVVMSQTCDKDATTDSIVTMRFNYASDQLRFRFYKSGQQPVQLYKKVESGGEEENPSSITVATAPTKTTYTAGEFFDPTGLVITATYSEGDPVSIAYADHASDFSFSPMLSTVLTTDNNSVSITYGGVSTTQAITVNTPVYSSLEALVAAGTPTEAGYRVTVTLTNEEIKSIFTSGDYRNGINLLSGSQTVLVYCRDVDEDWAQGGTVSGTLSNCTWKLFNGTWELCPTAWTELTYSAPSKTLPSLSFPETSYSVTYGNEFAAPELTNPAGVSVTYSVSNVNPAGCISITETGTVTINNAGTAKITASFAGNDTYLANSASYTLNVEDPNLAYTFDFTVNNFNLPTSAVKAEEKTYTYDGKTIKVYGDASNGFKYGGSGSHFHLIMGKSGAYLTLPTFDFAVSKIVVVGDSAASPSVVQNIYVGDVAVSTATTGVAQGNGNKLAITNTYLINEDYQAAGNIYTLKVTSAHNTQVTKIYIYKNPNAPTTPTLVVSPESLTLEADATSGEVTYTVSNPDGSTLSAAVNAEATWVSNVAIDSENNKVTFTTSANGPTAAREATITVTYGTIQKTVAITQKRLVLDYVELPFTIAAGTTGSALKATDGITCKIDGSDYNNDDYKIKLSGNTHYIQVKTNERIGACTFNFCGLANAGNSSFKLQESVDGTTWSDIEEFTINFPAKNDVQSWTSSASFSADARFVKLAFQKLTDEVNCGLGEFTISKYVAPASAHGEVSFVATNGDGYWATFSSTQNVIFDANDVVAYTIAVDGDNLEMLDVENNSYSCITDKTKNEGWVSGYYVQAGAGVLLYSTETSVNYYYIDTDPYTANQLVDVDTNNEYNLLRPASQAKETDGSYLFYKLAYGDADFTPSTLGFYWGADQGGAFTSREGSAYLAVSNSSASGAPARFVFGQTDITTDVESVEAETAVKFFENGQLLIKKNGVIYNALGQIVR